MRRPKINGDGIRGCFKRGFRAVCMLASVAIFAVLGAGLFSGYDAIYALFPSTSHVVYAFAGAFIGGMGSHLNFEKAGEKLEADP